MTVWSSVATRDILFGPVQQCAELHGARLVDLAVRGERGTRVVEVFVDNEAGVTTDLCAEISRSITRTIDSAGLLLGSYRLEVSSPGIDRPLTFPWQYRKHVGRLVDVTLKTESGVRKETGRLVSCTDAEIVMEVGSRKQQIRIPLADVNHLRVNTPW